MRNLIILLLCIAAALCGCKEDYDAPCRASHTDKLNLSVEEASLWPFSESDTIVYAGMPGDTIAVYADTWRSEYRTFSKPNNPECADDSVGYENRFIVFRRIESSLQFRVEAMKWEKLVKVTANGQSFSFRFSALAATDSANVDSITLPGGRFENVYFAVSQSGDSLYYNTTQGVLRVRSAGTYYSRIRL